MVGEEEIIINDEVKIYKTQTAYKIEFKYRAYELINSLIKTKIIRGASTDPEYKHITFKANTVTKFKPKPRITTQEAHFFVETLATQLNYLIANERQTIIGFAPKHLVLIDDTPAYLDSEFVAEIDAEGPGLATIYCPFYTNDFFLAPEILSAKTLPISVHYKTSYFSFALLIIYYILGDDEFYKDYLKNTQINNPLEALKFTPLYETKLFWLLSRCLDKDPKKRSIIYI